MTFKYKSSTQKQPMQLTLKQKSNNKTNKNQVRSDRRGGGGGKKGQTVKLV